MHRFSQVMLLALLLPGPAAAFTYTECLQLAGKRPIEAYEKAMAWASLDGGTAARHCAALALTAQGLHADAADRLEQIAEELTKERPGRRAEILGQAGNAWMLAGQVERAVAVFTTGIRLAPGSADLYLDRARGYAAVGDFAKALKDLDDTVILQPDWIEAFVFRASARRQTGDLKGARTDIDKAIAETPGNVDALLERGLIFRQEGNDRAARSDWLSVLRIDARSPAAEIARRNIELMDVKAD